MDTYGKSIRKNIMEIIRERSSGTKVSSSVQERGVTWEIGGVLGVGGAGLILRPFPAITFSDLKSQKLLT